MISKKVLDQAKNFPKQSGVYIMRDKEYKIIYIGKAKSLKNRINNYFSGQDKRVTVEFLVNKVASLDYIITSNEEEALLLERELIREHKPKYNIMLKDDKAYISIRIDINKDFPKIETVRKIQNDGALYFGPFSQGFKLKHSNKVYGDNSLSHILETRFISTKDCFISADRIYIPFLFLYPRWD